MSVFSIQLVGQQVLLDLDHDDLASVREELTRTRFLIGTTVDVGDEDGWPARVLIPSASIRWVAERDHRPVDLERNPTRRTAAHLETPMHNDTATPKGQTPTRKLSEGYKLHLIGPFRAKLTPTPYSLSAEEPERLHASLLTQAPTARSVGYVECPQTTTSRQPVRLARVGSKTLIIPHAFAFVVPGVGLIQQLGLFDDEGRLRYFGPLISSRQAFERPEEFRFEGGAVEIMQRGGGI